MDYDFFNSEYKKYEDWESNYLPKHTQAEKDLLKDGNHWLKVVEGYNKPDTISFGSASDQIFHPFGQKDMVNSPAHYTRGTQEVIDIIEESIQDAPDVKAGMLQAQALKYMLRLWLKGNAPQDAEKARWYLNRLIEHLENSQQD
jgi:hypothetical protein